MSSKYKFTSDCRQISGFAGMTIMGVSGTKYEQTCREMVIRGMEWFDANPNANPVFKEYENVTGFITEENNDAKALAKYITKGMDATGAMVQACVWHILKARKVGWDEYIKESEAEELNKHD